MRELKYRARHGSTWHYFTLRGLVVDAGPYYWLNNPDTIIDEFTGLLDDSDKEIYEGDIIEIRGTYYDTRREPVIFDFDMHAFMAGGRFLADFGKYFSLEIIGNIYENHDLIAE